MVTSRLHEREKSTKASCRVVFGVLIKVRHEPPEELVARDGLRVAHEDHMLLGPRDCYIHPAILRQESDLPVGARANHGDHHDLLLPALEAVNGAHLELTRRCSESPAIFFVIPKGAQQIDLRRVRRDDTDRGQRDAGRGKSAHVLHDHLGLARVPETLPILFSLLFHVASGGVNKKKHGKVVQRRVGDLICGQQLAIIHLLRRPCHDLLVHTILRHEHLANLGSVERVETLK
mmetsp:Transcript_312/g.809  ORF Transcript_312/g.809 Transcript_312/m.809 type:complete len:233 (-) Transcript_312:973-1671(-)